MKQIFINLPVKNVEASMAFYTHLGFTVNPLFTLDDQKCMVRNIEDLDGHNWGFICLDPDKFKEMKGK